MKPQWIITKTNINMKTVVGLSNFFKNNTPKIVQIIGDLGITVAFVGASIIGLPMALAEAGINDFKTPEFLLVVAKYCLGIGAVIKFLTKFFGQIESTFSKQKA